MSKTIKYTLKTAGAAAAIAAVLLTSPAMAGWDGLNLPKGVTELSQEAYRLHMLILYWCIAIAVAVFSVMIYSLVKFRKSQGAVPDKTLLHSTKVEIIWTIIPIVILIFMAIPAARALIKIEDTSNSKLTVLVTGFQWKWKYDYQQEGVSFYSTLDRESDAVRQLHSGKDPSTVQNYLLNVDHPMVVPVNTKVRVLLTAGDVIHAWWVPALGVKKDAIPGFINEVWFDAKEVGVYRGQCTELCGRDHGFMPIVVEVKSQADYEAWLQAQKQPAAATPAPAAETATPAAQ
jgi:cytochrome c oxidase subunit II